MSDNDNEDLDSSNQTDDDNDNGQDNSVADTDTVETLKEKLAQKDEQNKKLFVRTKKAEGFEQQPDGSWVKVVKKPEIKPDAKPAPVAQTDDGHTQEDFAVLVSKVPDKEDREIVKKYAKAEGVSFEEALNNQIVQTILKDTAEKRQTANATNTGPARRGTTKPSAEAILADVEKGKLPENANDLVEARFESKKKK